MYNGKMFRDALNERAELKLSYAAFLIEKAMFKSSEFDLRINDVGNVIVRYIGPALPLGPYGGFSNVYGLMSRLSDRLAAMSTYDGVGDELTIYLG